MSIKPKKSKTQNFYDRIAEVHHFALQINGYEKSVAKYLRSLDLQIDSDSVVLDAGSGTGIVSKGFYRAGFKPRKTIALDLSRNSLEVARKQVLKERSDVWDSICHVQGNVLSLPFEDAFFDTVLTCGVLEYIPLDEGLREMARVLKPGSKLVLIPIKPSIVGSVLEFLYKFNAHPIKDVKRVAQKYFNVLGDFRFPITEPISWSKMIFLLEKK
ncbi:MAG: class I SAM-dependent methyltransferase [Pyrinomonadaceae bacterium]|nr:class I SAM-dependent methyltransferase [Pyrinomonadaceae bacterium]